MTDQVSVEFGGSTSGLSRAAGEAKAEIAGVGNSASGLASTFSNVSSKLSGMFSGITAPAKAAHGALSEVSEASKSLVENARVGQFHLATFGLRLEEIAAKGVGLLPILAAVGTALIGLYAAKEVLEFGEHMASTAEQIDKTSQKLGINTTKLQEWHGVAILTHMSAEQMDNGFMRLERSLSRAAQGSKTQAEAFQRLGINIRELKDPTDAVLQMADKFNKMGMEKSAQKIALSMQLMGRTGAQLIPVLNEGSEKIKEMMKTTEDLGYVMSEDLIKKGKEAAEQYNQLSLASTGLKNILFAELAPTIISLTTHMIGMAKALIESYRSGGLVKQIADVLIAVFKGLAMIVVNAGAAFIEFSEVAIGAIKVLLAPLYAVYDGIKRITIALRGGSGQFDAFKKDMDGVGKSVQHNMDAFHAAGDAAAKFNDLMGKGLGKAPTLHGIPQANMDLGEPGAGKSKKAKTHKPKADHSADKALALKLEELSAEMDAEKDNYDKLMQLEDQKLAAIAKVHGKASKEYQTELRKKEQMEREHLVKLDELTKASIEHRKALDETRMNSDYEHNKKMLDNERERLNEREQMGEISASKKAQLELDVTKREEALEQAHEEAMYQLALKEFNDELALQHLKPEERRKINEEVEKLEAKHIATMRALHDKADADIAKGQNTVLQAAVDKYKGMIAPITNGFAAMTKGMLQGTMTLRQGLLNICDSIVGSFVDMGAKIFTDWAAKQLGMRAVHAASKSAETAANATAAATQAATTMGANFASILSTAPLAAANAFSSTAAIPIVGPALAPGAAAAAMAAVTAMAPMAWAEGGYDIPAGVNPLTQLHQKEMVLPAHLAVPLRAMLAGAGPRASGLGASAMAAGSSMRGEGAPRGGDVHLHHSPSYPAPGPGVSMEHLLKTEGDRLIRYLKVQQRDGRF